MVAIGYVRRSKESGERTVSLEAQTEHVREYVERQGWALVSVLTDDGISGGKRERFERIKAAVKAFKAQHVVTYHFDRFARDIAGMLDTLRGFAKKGIDLHVVGVGRVDVGSSNGFLAVGMQGLIAEHFRLVVGEKTADALSNLKAHGLRYTHILPYGYRLGPDGRSLVPDPQEQATLAVIHELTPGRTLRHLSRELAARGLLARSGRPFSVSLLHKVIRDSPIVNSRAKAG